ncbi:MAG: hypothetical protein Q7J20_05140 [Candidatus Nitrotoga sp.]|nr:hypothetical protein [Candidatus Nitrotoga sp.]MDO9447272.1 hypothetical protein [Candidatus Nitrotoga sp.]MDP3497887.1 hypothetical protein [Candidatus Nitrotoga sp.]
MNTHVDRLEESGFINQHAERAVLSCSALCSAGATNIFCSQDGGSFYIFWARWLLGFREWKLTLSNPDELGYPFAVV